LQRRKSVKKQVETVRLFRYNPLAPFYPQLVPFQNGAAAYPNTSLTTARN